MHTHVHTCMPADPPCTAACRHNRHRMVTCHTWTRGTSKRQGQHTLDTWAQPPTGPSRPQDVHTNTCTHDKDMSWGMREDMRSHARHTPRLTDTHKRGAPERVQGHAQTTVPARAWARHTQSPKRPQSSSAGSAELDLCRATGGRDRVPASTSPRPHAHSHVHISRLDPTWPIPGCAPHADTARQAPLPPAAACVIRKRGVGWVLGSATGVGSGRWQ